jgi:hypothetical protein
VIAVWPKTPSPVSSRARHGRGRLRPSRAPEARYDTVPQYGRCIKLRAARAPRAPTTRAGKRREASGLDKVTSTLDGSAWRTPQRPVVSGLASKAPTDALRRSTRHGSEEATAPSAARPGHALSCRPRERPGTVGSGWYAPRRGQASEAPEGRDAVGRYVRPQGHGARSQARGAAYVRDGGKGSPGGTQGRQGTGTCALGQEAAGDRQEGRPCQMGHPPVGDSGA